MKSRTITFVNPTFFSYAQRILKGISRYVAAHPELRLRVLNHPGFEPLWGNELLHGGGVIGIFGSAAEARRFRKDGGLVVNAASLTDTIRPWVHIDETAVGRMAGEAFLMTGLSRFAFVAADFSTPVPLLFHRNPQVPIAGSYFSRRRQEGFREALRPRQASHESFILDSGIFGTPPQRRQAMRRLCGFLQSIPNPFGILCANDLIGHLVLEGCRQAGLSVPAQVQVLGIDNDDLLCLGSNPPLASIDQGEERVGWNAARLLHELLQGQGDPAAEVCLEPVELVERESFNPEAGIVDEAIQPVLRRMRQRLDQRLPIHSLAQLAGLERRTFERRFRRTVGRSPAEELARIRLETARQLLLSSRKSVKDIAAQCGYAGAKRLHEAFQKTFGVAPLAYRRRHAALEPKLGPGPWPEGNL